MAQSNVTSIVQPDPNHVGEDYNFHVWRKDYHGDVWLGFFKDADVALDWAKTLNFDVTINNVPPTTSRRAATTDYAAHGINPVVVDVAEAVVPKPKAKKTKKTKTTKVAEELLGQHRADEIADIAAGLIEEI